MSIQKINPAALYDASVNGMSQATVDTGTGLVFVSGQVDWDRDYATGSQDIGSQAESAFNNLNIVLEEANSSLEDILQLRIYVRGEVADHMGVLGPILVKYFGESCPALTGVGVASLASPDLLIEIEAVARVSE